MRFSPRVLLACLPLVLTGCSLVQTAAPVEEAGVSITGNVHGGQAPITGAHVYLLAANTTAYGAASVSLLTSGTGRTLDSSGGATNGFYYVTSGANGSFSITGDYTCTAGQQVYLYSLGGNPGSGTNSVAGLMAALGNCPGGSFASSTFVFMNEVSTVAAAYAMSGFATDALHVSSSGTAQAKLGIANAFVNAAVLETLSTGVANQFPPALPTGAGGGAVPQSEINTLGNILAACVNSTGAVTGPTNATACYTLFTNAMSGGMTGTQPTDTATAAINIAHNPVGAVSALYGLSSAYAQFSPALTAQPNDFTMSIYYSNPQLYDTGGPLAADASGNIWAAANSVFKFNGQAYDFTGGTGYSGFYGAQDIAIDVNGNAWAVNTSSVGKFNNSGTLISPAGGYTGLGLTGVGQATPISIAMDASSNAWISNDLNHAVVKVSSSGTLSGTYSGTGGLSAPGPVAIDTSGDAWIADTSSGAIVELSNTGTPLSGTGGYTGVGLNAPTGIAIDHSGNVWVSNSGGTYGSVTEISKTGTLLSGSGFTSSALGNPTAITIDGAGNAWTVGPGAINEISPAGSFLSGSTGFPAAEGSNVTGMTIDGSGDVWVNYDPYSFLFGYSYYMQEMVGAATPVVTPLSVGVENNTLGTRP
jgi:streptogramin lyase